MKKEINISKMERAYAKAEKLTKDVEYLKNEKAKLEKRDKYGWLESTSKRLEEREAELVKAEEEWNKLSKVFDEEMNAVQGRCKERTISYSTIVNKIEELERTLGITKKSMEGIEFECDPHAQILPGAYKYTAMSTKFRCYMKNGTWRVTNVFRTGLWQGHNQFRVVLTDEAKAEIIKKHERF